MLYEWVIGEYAPILSSFAGLLGAFLLLLVPIKSWGYRESTLNLLISSKDERLAALNETAYEGLQDHGLKELEREKRLTRWGASLLMVSFLILLLHTIDQTGWLASSGTGSSPITGHQNPAQLQPSETE